MFKNILSKVCFLCMLMSIISCSDNNNEINPTSPGFISLSLPQGVDRDLVLSNIDTTNMIGWFNFTNTTGDENYASINFTTQKNIDASSAFFYLEGDFYSDAGRVFVNDHEYFKMPDGSNIYVPYDLTKTTGDMVELQFPGSNFIDVESTATSDSRIPDFSLSINFPNNLTISNIQVNDVYNKSNSIPVSWNGNEYDYVGIYLDNAIESIDLGKNYYNFTKHINNVGNYTITPSDLSSFVPGYYTLTVKGYKLATKDVGNGKKIGYLIQSVNVISIKLE